jgi:hypothetical protein
MTKLTPLYVIIHDICMRLFPRINICMHLHHRLSYMYVHNAVIYRTNAEIGELNYYAYIRNACCRCRFPDLREVIHFIIPGDPAFLQRMKYGGFGMILSI